MLTFGLSVLYPLHSQTTNVAGTRLSSLNNPALTAVHTPLFWRCDLNLATNLYLMERLGINGVFSAGAM